jgi:phage shock protein PspC (stress-responsive transcriptional regulator)
LRDAAPAAAFDGKQVRLSTADRMIAGVCGGLGEFFALDPVLFRAAFLVLAVIGGLGIVLYLVLWLLIPGPTSREPPSSPQ